MNAHNKLDRETLLRLVDQTLDEAEDQSADGTLGVVVRQMMTRLSDRNQTATNDDVNSKPVPVYDVAAYVDGSLRDRKQIDDITDAAATDPGLMMEIVAAFQSQRATPVEPLSAGLRSRLIALPASPRSDNDSDVFQLSPNAVVGNDAPTGDEDAASGEESLPQITPVPTPSTKPRSPRESSRTLLFAGLMAIAAAIFFGIGWWVRSGIDSQSQPIAVDQPQISERVNPSLVEPEREAESERDEIGPVLAEDSDVPPSTPTELDEPRVLVPGPDEVDAMDVALEPKDGTVPKDGTEPDDGTDSMVTVRPDSESVLDEPEPMVVPEINRGLPQPTRLVARWDQIDGLLLRSTTRGFRPGEPGRNEPTRTGQSSSDSNDSGIASVASGSETRLASGAIGERLRLETLPLCRATAKLDGGGELVIAADTQLELTVGGAIDLRYGSFALMGLDPEMIIRIGRNLASSVSVQSQPGGTIVVRKTLDGIEMDVVGQASRIAGQSYEDSRVAVATRTLEPTRLEDAPERLPRWTRERVDRIELGRNVLGQLSSSSDVRTTMMQALKSGAVRGEGAATLRRWLVVANSDNLLRLIGAPDPLLREAALQHLRTVDPKDPRHRPLWVALQMRGKNSRTFASVRSFFVELWAKRRPNATRREQLLRMLQAPEPAARATANFLLRGFYGPGPRFELNATPNAIARSVNAWRVIINRVD